MDIPNTNQHFSAIAKKKITHLTSNPIGFFIAAMMAGAYVGVGIILILSVGEHADPSVRTLVMGASFGIALTLVMFAGSELFTGYTMYMTQGVLGKTVTPSQAVMSWTVVWVGNLVGCLLLASIAVVGDINIVGAHGELLFKLAEKKMHLEPHQMVARAMLCNWLVCLSIWTSARTDNDVAKIMLIFWCLFAFIASGFEHSVANMTVFSLALLADHGEAINMAGAAKSLFWVTLGNTLSGVFFLAGGYWAVGKKTARHTGKAAVIEQSA